MVLGRVSTAGVGSRARFFRGTWAGVRVVDREVLVIPGDGTDWAEHLGLLARQLGPGPRVVADHDLDALHGDRLKTLRTERGWSQADLAEKIGSDARQVSR